MAPVTATGARRARGIPECLPWAPASVLGVTAEPAACNVGLNCDLNVKTCQNAHTNV